MKYFRIEWKDESGYEHKSLISAESSEAAKAAIIHGEVMACMELDPAELMD